MPERQRAGRRVGRQIRDQPLMLGRPGCARDPPAFVARVQRDDVPTPDVEAVVPAAAGTGHPGHLPRSIEIVEVASGDCIDILVIARNRVGEGEKLGATPAGPVVRFELAEQPAGVGLVTDRQHGDQPLDLQEVLQQTRGRVLRASPTGDVTRGSDDHTRGPASATASGPASRGVEPLSLDTAAASIACPPPSLPARARALHPHPMCEDAPAHRTPTTPIRSTTVGFSISARRT